MTKEQMKEFMNNRIEFYEGFLKQFEDKMEELSIAGASASELQLEYFKILNIWRAKL